MKPVCRVARLVPDGLWVGSPAYRHRGVCLRCQAEEARARSLLREMATLREEVLPAPAWVHARAMARLGDQDEHRRGIPPRLARALGGVVAATAIGAAAVFGGLARRRARAAG